MNIYDKIWQNDEHRFTVSKKDKNGKFRNPSADILLNEQLEAAGTINNDLAKDPLFYSVNEDKLKSGTFPIFKKLLNNYIVNITREEEYTREELNEINEFLDSVRVTKVWQLTSKYIKDTYNEDLEANYHSFMFDLWFRIYTNWYKGNRTDFCTGFEHVFVGEGILTQNPGIISGYHNWIKFYLDEKLKRVNFYGHFYGLNNDDGPNNPDVVTLQMSWTHQDINGNDLYKLFKFRGGFFVGSTPECEICLAVLSYFKGKKSLSLAPLFVDNVTIGKGLYQLNLWRNTLQNGTAGKYVRSFFPILLENIPHSFKSNDYAEGSVVKQIENEDEPITIYSI